MKLNNLNEKNGLVKTEIIVIKKNCITYLIEPSVNSKIRIFNKQSNMSKMFFLILYVELHDLMKND